MNDAALRLPRHQLPDALLERRRLRAEQVAARDAAFGADRVRVTSYMENIGWPELLGYDMNDYYADPDLAVEMLARQKIFWADNSDDDSDIDLTVTASTGFYYDMTLFGQVIRHTPEGVPQFDPHPITTDPRLERIAPFDFQSSGEMPVLIARYRRMAEINRREYGGQLQVVFPCFHRGPLDTLLQLRGYDGFIADAADRPELVRAFLDYFTRERLRYAAERQRFLGEPRLPDTTAVADDWVNIPFISPAMFRRFVLPVYRRIRAEEGPVTYFHTCGNLEAVALDLLEVFPELRRLEVSGWNDPRAIDRIVPLDIALDYHTINTLVLAAPLEDQRAKLEAFAVAARRRRVLVCAQSMVKLVSYEDTLARMNAFIALARQVFASA
jgi:hypothetical protein